MKTLEQKYNTWLIHSGGLAQGDMTMRDHFAGLAMQACIAKGAPFDLAIADKAYAMADAMLKERATTWRKLLVGAMEETKESFADIESSTLTEAELDTEFNNGYGGSEGVPFTVWTKTHVYFPAVYDGAEWVSCVPRNPNGHATEHVGGQ